MSSWRYFPVSQMIFQFGCLFCIILFHLYANSTLYIPDLCRGTWLPFFSVCFTFQIGIVSFCRCSLSCWHGFLQWCAFQSYISHNTPHHSSPGLSPPLPPGSSRPIWNSHSLSLLPFVLLSEIHLNVIHATSLSFSSHHQDHIFFFFCISMLPNKTLVPWDIKKGVGGGIDC